MRAQLQSWIAIYSDAKASSLCLASPALGGRPPFCGASRRFMDRSRACTNSALPSGRPVWVHRRISFSLDSISAAARYCRQALAVQLFRHTSKSNISFWGSTLQEAYLLGPSGEHITELGQAGVFMRSNVYANGQLLATYANNKTYFALNDWLGTKRVVTNYDGTVAQMCMNLPFGDELMCSAPDVNEQHFTGQIHDSETGNDYFNARYYSNSTGRFLSPDPSGLDYVDPANPQSLNLYSYVNNNPLVSLDPSGLALQISCNSVPSSYTDDGSGGLIVTGYSDSCTYTDDGQDGLTQPSTSFQKQSTLHPLNLPARHFVAPNNNQTSCVGGVLAENAVSLGLDLLGTLPIPEAGGITRLVGQQLGAAKIGAIYRGVVADQQGANFLNGLRNSTSAGALFGNGSDTSGLGLASTAVGGAALTAGYFVPVLGQILSGGQLLIDAIHTYNTIQAKCYGHS
jgi:RHS repeat-associated protein